MQNKKTLVNDKINAKEVLLIDGEQNKNIVSFEDAMQQASKLNLDLVQVSPRNTEPVVCKILDYGKLVFEKKRMHLNLNKKQKKTTVKEIKFRPTTDIGDYNIKLKKIKSFINNGDKSKISVRFRGREILNSNLGLELLNRIKEELSDIAQVDQEPSLEGRQLLMVLSPIRKNN